MLLRYADGSPDFRIDVRVLVVVKHMLKAKMFWRSRIKRHYSPIHGESQEILKGVMSSRLCKKLEGAVFPVEVEPLEDRVNNSIHALHVDKADHGPGSAPDFHKATLNDVSGAQLAPQMLGKAIETQQLRQVLL